MMDIMTIMCLVGVVVGVVMVASNPSPYFATFALMGVSCSGCGALVINGGSFLSLLLFLIYLGGMVVVFAFATALSADPHPEAVGNWRVGGRAVIYVGVMMYVVLFFCGVWEMMDCILGEDNGEFRLLRGEIGGISILYGLGGLMLIFGAWVLLLTLFVALELTRGLGRGGIRAI